MYKTTVVRTLQGYLSMVMYRHSGELATQVENCWWIGHIGRQLRSRRFPRNKKKEQNST